MKWNLTDDQKKLVAIIRENRTLMISAEEFATIITDAGFHRDKADNLQDGGPMHAHFLRK